MSCRARRRRRRSRRASRTPRPSHRRASFGRGSGATLGGPPRSSRRPSHRGRVPARKCRWARAPRRLARAIMPAPSPSCAAPLPLARSLPNCVSTTAHAPSDACAYAVPRHERLRDGARDGAVRPVRGRDGQAVPRAQARAPRQAVPLGDRRGARHDPAEAEAAACPPSQDATLRGGVRGGRRERGGVVARDGVPSRVHRLARRLSRAARRLDELPSPAQEGEGGRREGGREAVRPLL